MCPSWWLCAWSQLLFVVASLALSDCPWFIFPVRSDIFSASMLHRICPLQTSLEWKDLVSTLFIRLYIFFLASVFSQGYEAIQTGTALIPLRPVSKSWEQGGLSDRFPHQELGSAEGLLNAAGLTLMGWHCPFFFYCEKIKSSESLGVFKKKWEMLTYINVKRSYLVYRSNKATWNYCTKRIV